MAGCLFFEPPVTVEIRQGVAHVTPANYPDGFTMAAYDWAEMCAHGLSVFEEWEDGEADKLVSPAPIFERRGRAKEPAAH